MIGADTSKFKDVIKGLIQYYILDCDQSTGGPHLHYMLNDGNISHAGICTSKEECMEDGDFLGALICDVLLNHFSEEEIEAMYKNDWV